MAFKLPKSKGDIFGINEELSEWGRPVFEKNLDENIVAEANNDGTTFVDKKASAVLKKKAVNHENAHHDQMQQGRLQYDDNKVTWKPDTKTGSRVYIRDKGQLISMTDNTKDVEGGNFPWEDEARAAE